MSREDVILDLSFWLFTAVQHTPPVHSLHARTAPHSSSSYGMTSPVIPALWGRCCHQHHFIYEETEAWEVKCLDQGPAAGGGDWNAHPGCPPGSVSTWLKKTWDLEWRKGDMNPGSASGGQLHLLKPQALHLSQAQYGARGTIARGWWWLQELFLAWSMAGLLDAILLHPGEGQVALIKSVAAREPAFLKDGEEGSRSIFLHFSFYLLPGVLFFLFHNKQQIAPYKDLISVVHTERIETDILHFPRVRLYF